MSEIVTYDTKDEALQWQPYRSGVKYYLFSNPLSGDFQWMSSRRASVIFGMRQVYPELLGFGLIRFGLDQFGD